MTMVSTGSSMIESLSGYGVSAAFGAAVLKLAETWMSRRRTPEDLAAAVIEAAETHMEGMRSDFKALRDRLDQIERSHRDCEARCDQLTGELHQARQKIDSLTRQVNRAANAVRSPRAPK